MEVTYEKILGGYILNTGDTLCLHGVEYKVEPHGDTYFLDNRGGFNGTIFQVLGINKVDFCEKIVGVKTYGGDFPEVNSLIDLTIVVKALYERSPYKVGDKVKLKDDVHGYPWVVSMMEKDAGKVVTIKDITLIHFSKHLNGDPHQYRFKEIVCTWSPQTIDHKVEDTCTEVSPRTVTRDDLKAGYILMPGDIIKINGMRHAVHPNQCFLHNLDYDLNKLFYDLGIKRDEKRSWASKFGKINPIGCFPVFENYKDLTHFVLDIFDKVDILHKEGKEAVRKALSFEKDDDSYCSCASSHDADMKSSTDCHLVEESIIIQTPKPKIKTTIKL